MRVARAAMPFALLLLGACDYFGGATADSADGEPSGEVLAGSVSDAMIPTDDLTSQPPALAIQPGEGGATADASAVEGEAAVDSAAAGPAAETAPAEPEAAAE